MSQADSQEPSPRGPAVSFRVIGQDLSENGYVFVTDSEGNARHASISIAKSWVRVRNAPEDFRIWALWRVGKFGRVMVKADNGGKGYNAGDAPHVLNVEFARTRARELGEPLPEFTGTEQEKAVQADAALERLMFEGEKRVLEQASRGIEKHRKGDAVIRVVDSAGRPVAGARVEATQTSRDFLIGYNAMGPYDKYRDRFVGIVNYATLPFYLKSLAPEQGRYEWKSREESVKWHAAHGIKCKGHPLTWFFDATTPDYLKEMDWPQTLEFCLENARKNVDRFEGRIDWWDVINEAHSWANGKWSQEQMNELTDALAREVKRANPNALVVVNSCLPLGQYVQWKPKPDSVTPYQYYERLNAMGTPYDVIGLQMYNGIESPFPTCDIALMSETLDRYSKLGKPIHVTEFSVPSDADKWGSWHGEKWTEETQAEYLKAFYTLAFSKPYVDAVTWWCFWDGATWVPNTGILRKDLSEKPAYTALKDLVQSWTTTASGETNASGELRLRGFRGEYAVKVSSEGNERVVKVEVGKGPVVESVVL